MHKRSPHFFRNKMITDVIEKPRVHRTKHGEGYESKRIQQRLEDFNYKASPAYQLITGRFGELQFPELQYIAEVVCEKLSDIYPIRLDRCAKRNIQVIYKWFQENLGVAAPIINNMEISDSLQYIICQMENN